MKGRGREGSRREDIDTFANLRIHIVHVGIQAPISSLETLCRGEQAKFKDSLSSEARLTRSLCLQASKLLKLTPLYSDP